METDYRIVRELGKGAFGTVYLIKHKTDDEVFALKAVDLGKADAKERESAQKEAALMSKLDHDHVVRYVSSYFHGSTLFIFTEYCEGGDLSHFLEDTDGSLPEDLIVCWVYQTVSALDYLHTRKILHRDLKPQNIYLNANADIKLGDLGIARILDKGADMATTMAGTPCYMSPEIFQMKGYNHKTDIWSFGCVVYELAAGQRAFDAPIIQFLIFKVVAGIVPPIQSSYSAQLRELVKSMMAKEPDHRPSASEILGKSPVKEFKDRLRSPREIMQQNKLKTKWGTYESTVDLKKMMTAMRFDPPTTFKESDIRIPRDSLSLHRERLGRLHPPSAAAASKPVSKAEAGGNPSVYSTIMAGKSKQKEKAGQKMVEVTMKQDLSRSEMSEGRAAIMEAVMRGLMGHAGRSADSTLTSTSSTSSSVSSDMDSTRSSTGDWDTTLSASQGTSTKKAVEAQFLMRQIEVLQRHCAAGLGEPTLLKAYNILDSVSNPVQLKQSLVRLMGEDKFRQFGDKIMYLRLFEVGLDKVQSQIRK